MSRLGDVARLPGVMIEAAQATGEMAQRLSGLQRAVVDRLRSVDQGLHEVIAVLPSIAGNLERVRATVEPQHERVAAIEQGLAILPALAADLQATRATIEPQHARVAAIEDAIAGLAAVSADLGAVRATIEPQHERVATIEAAVARVEALLGEVRGALVRLEGGVEEAAERLPDPDAPGPIARAREAITGRS
jgi:chromosome segregation ATPase